MNCAIGIDIGATNIKVLAVTPAGKVLAEVEEPTGDEGRRNWRENVRRVFEQVRKTVDVPVGWVGVAAPGLADRNGESIAIMPGRLPGLVGTVWRKFLKASVPVPVINDAQAALLGEVWLGAAKGARDAFLLTLGTGVGGAAMVDGRLLRGHAGRAGHLGHISLDPAGAPDIVNTPGSLESVVGECTVRERSGGRFQTTSALVAASRAGDLVAREVWLASVRGLAAGVASLINVLDPAVVVIGGGIAGAGPELFRPLKQDLKRFEWRPKGTAARVVPSKLGTRAGAFGAAWNAMQSANGRVLRSQGERSHPAWNATQSAGGRVE